MSTLIYNESEKMHFSASDHNFITIMGKGNKKIIDNLLFNKKNPYITLNGNKVSMKNINEYRKNVSFVLNERLNVFTSETVEDELAYGMENLGLKKSTMHESILNLSSIFDLDGILDADPTTIGYSKKALIKILSCMVCDIKILVLDNILCELDKVDRKRIIEYLISFVKKGGIVLNFTADVEETLFGNYIILTDEDKIIASGRTLGVLNEEKLMNRLGLSLPFKFDLNKQLMYYDLVSEYILDEERLVDAIWK